MSGIKVYSDSIKVFSINWRRIKLQFNNEEGIKLNVLILNPQRQIYDDSAVYSLSDSNAALRTEVKHLIHSVNGGVIEWMADRLADG